MQQQEVIDLIKKDFPNAEVLVEGEDCSFKAVVIDDSFASMGLLQKQKSILATVKAQITDGSLHAMSVKAYTPDEWQKQQQQQSGDGLSVLS